MQSTEMQMAYVRPFQAKLHIQLLKSRNFFWKRFSDTGRKFFLTRKPVLWGWKCQCLYPLIKSHLSPWNIGIEMFFQGFLGGFCGGWKKFYTKTHDLSLSLLCSETCFCLSDTFIWLIFPLMTKDYDFPLSSILDQLHFLFFLSFVQCWRAL